MKLNLVEDTVPARMVLRAVSTFVKDADFIEKFASNGPIVDVKLLVNGHEVPLVETLAEIWEQQSKKLIDTKAKAIALDMVNNDSQLDTIRDLLCEVEQLIRNKLNL